MELNVLHEIDEELTKSEVAALKFLCSDVIPRKRLENVKDAKDLFLRLREKALLENGEFLSELLYTIGRYDLLVCLGTSKTDVSGWLQTQTDSSLGICLYRKMLYKLSEDVTSENLRAMKFLLGGLPKAKLQDSTTFLDVLTEMEKLELLSANNLDGLIQVLDKCDKQLASQVQEFQNSRREPEQPMETRYVQHPVSVAETSPDVPGRMSGETVVTDAAPAPASDPDPVETPVEIKEEEFYSLKQKPRGYCLIINNYDFGKAPAYSRLRRRTGTHKDVEELRDVFTMLHFQIMEKTDLCASEMLRVVKEFAGMDHSEMDAFVCCILSHGLKGTVLGADAGPVQIRDITLAFAHSPTLLNKPKVFFIQACQGNRFQSSIKIQSDGDDDDDDEEESEEELEDDAQAIPLPSIPIEADFLIGMATVESYKSFRHTQTGSIFIQELCRQLRDGLQRKEDILSILTRVNREVSIKVLNGHKQMPEPRYTLTKKLVFTTD